MNADEWRVLVKEIVEDECDVAVRLQGKRIVIDDPDGTVVILVSAGRIEKDQGDLA